MQFSLTQVAVLGLAMASQATACVQFRANYLTSGFDAGYGYAGLHDNGSLKCSIPRTYVGTLDANGGAVTMDCVSGYSGTFHFAKGLVKYFHPGGNGEFGTSTQITSTEYVWTASVWGC